MTDFVSRARETAEREAERAMPLTGGPADGMRKSSWELYGMGAEWAVSRLPSMEEIAVVLAAAREPDYQAVEPEDLLHARAVRELIEKKVSPSIET